MCPSLPTRPTTEGVILLHGLARRARSLHQMECALRKAGYKTANPDYPSCSAPIQELSTLAINAALATPELHSCTIIHAVTHSMGGILLRDYLAREAIPRLGRVVMLGPPNQGSELVDLLRSWWLFRWLHGPAGLQLGTDPDSWPNQLGPVSFELGVIAGNRSINWINSCLLPGPDDGKVTVARTRVEGMRAHLVLPVTHPCMMNNRQVIRATLHFLNYGNWHSIAKLEESED